MKFYVYSKLLALHHYLLMIILAKHGKQNHFQILKRLAKLKIKRKYHHYLKCEEYKTNMWKQIPVEIRENAIKQSRDLLLNIDEFSKAMRGVIDNWIYSCEANLTARVINHQAWLGAAACAFNHDAPEDLTKLAWSTLTEEEQALANKSADEAKEYWLGKYNAKN